MDVVAAGKHDSAGQGKARTSSGTIDLEDRICFVLRITLISSRFLWMWGTGRSMQSNGVAIIGEQRCRECLHRLVMGLSAMQLLHGLHESSCNELIRSGNQVNGNG